MLMAEALHQLQLEFEDLVYSIEKIQQVQDEIDKIDGEAFEKVLEIEQKYNAIRKPVYVKRNEAIHSIPDFWSIAFLNHPKIGALLTDEDQKIFKHVDSLYVEEFEDIRMGYYITFNFKPNPYFENTKLTKTIKFFNDGTMTVTGTTIIWKEGKGHVDVSGDAEKGSKRSLSKESFFNWFGKPRPEETKVEQDWVADSIKEDIWPNPVNMYLNKEAEYDDEDEDEDEDEEDADDEDCSDDDE